MGSITFRTTDLRERAVDLLALKYRYTNRTELLNALIDREIKSLSPEELSVLDPDGSSAREHGVAYKAERPKTRSGRRAQNQVAS